MEAHRFLPALLAVPLFLAGLTLVPGAQAQESGWTTAFLPATKSVCATSSCPVYAAQNGGEILVAFEVATDDVLILHKASDSAAWTQKTADALGGPAPAVVGVVGGLEYLSATDTWVLAMGATGATANYLSLYASTDDGATWTLSSTANIGGAYTFSAADNAGGYLECLYFFTDVYRGCAAPRPVPDGGASGAIRVSDNRGDPSVGASATTGAPVKGALFASDVFFDGSGIHYVTCSTVFCEVPFGTEATGHTDGSTNPLEEFPCWFDDANPAPTVNYVSVGGGNDEGGNAYFVATDTDRICIGPPYHDGSRGDIILNPTAATGAFAAMDGTDWFHASSAATQGLTMAWDDTVNKNYVFYGTSLTLELGADTKSGIVTCGTAKCYAIYRDGTYGGAMRVSEATDFPTLAGSYRFSSENYFCAERGAEHFAYNYVEGVSFQESSGALTEDLDDYFLFRGDADNFDYLGKILPASYGAKLFFTVEAATEGIDSVFRAGFSFVDHTPYDLGAPTHYLNGPNDNSVDEDFRAEGTNAKGNGKEEEVFSRWIEVRLLEVENDWNIAIYYVDTSASIDERTKLGQSKLADDPNGINSYVLTLDTLTGYVGVRHADGTIISTGSTDGLNMTLPTGFLGDQIYGQWFVGYATDTAFNNDADTKLNNNDGDAGSTCIYLLVQDEDGDGLADTPEACIGECGSQGPTLVFDGNNSVPENLEPGSGEGGSDGGGSQPTPGGADGNLFRAPGAVLPPGFTAATFDFFLGLLLMFSVTAGLFFITGKSLIGAAIGAVLGMLAAYAFGLFALWVIIVVLIIAVALIFIQVKGRGASA